MVNKHVFSMEEALRLLNGRQMHAAMGSEFLQSLAERVVHEGATAGAPTLYGGLPEPAKRCAQRRR